MSSNLAKRLLVSAVGIPALIFIIYKGGLLLFAFCLLVSILGAWELAALLLAKRYNIGKRLATLLVVIIVSIFQFSADGRFGLIIMSVIFFVAASAILIKIGTANYMSNLAMSFFTAFYPAFFISFAILVRREFASIGWVILLFVFVNTWISDTFAYAFGKMLGRRKLAPAISPNKTWAGFVFAFPGGILAAIAAYYYLQAQLGLTVLLIASIAATFFGQIGDLVESAVKRDSDVKDSSNLIPGHGGVLDRFDSLLFALPSVYFVMKIFGV